MEESKFNSVKVRDFVESAETTIKTTEKIDTIIKEIETKTQPFSALKIVVPETSIDLIISGDSLALFKKFLEAIREKNESKLEKQFNKLLEK